MDGRTSTALYVDRFLLSALALIWPVCAAIVSIVPPAARFGGQPSELTVCQLT